MPKPGWLTLLLRIIGFAGRVATQANESFPHTVNTRPAPSDSAEVFRHPPVAPKLADLAAEAKKRRVRRKPSA